MIDWATNKLAAWSVRAYGLILQVYPYAFRREFGESMTQAFRDLARNACKQSGVVGLAALWTRTVADVLVSVVDAYASERRESMFRVVVAVGVLYVCTLAFAMGYGAIRFGEFYDPPAFSRFGAGLVLAILLGVASALFGLWQRSVFHGAGAFVPGTVLTIAALCLLPTIWFRSIAIPSGLCG